MKNAKTMREELAKLYEQVKSKEVDRRDAKEMTNICSKMINSALVQVRYYHEQKEIPNIEFLNEK